MLPILWRAEAQANLAATLEYIAERNPQSALDLYDDIERVVSQLPHHPYLYRLGRVSGTRELVAHPNYIVVYRVTNIAIRNSLRITFAAALSVVSNANHFGPTLGCPSCTVFDQCYALHKYWRKTQARRSRSTILHMRNSAIMLASA